MNLTDQNPFPADQFVIRKTIQKSLVRSESDPYLAILQSKKKNMALYINKKYSNIILKGENGVVTGSAAIKELARTIDKQSHHPKILEKLHNQLEEELAAVRKRAKSTVKEPLKRHKKMKKDQNQVLKTFIQDRIDQPKLDDLYKKYKLEKLKGAVRESTGPEDANPQQQQQEQKQSTQLQEQKQEQVVEGEDEEQQIQEKLERLKQQLFELQEKQQLHKQQQHDQLMQKISEIAEKSNKVEQMNEVFVTKTLEDPNLNINALLSLKNEISKQALPLKPPEEHIIDDIIRKHRDKKFRKIMLEQTEEKEVVRLFRYVETQTFKSARMSDLEIRKIKETQDKFSAEDRQKEEVIMLARKEDKPPIHDTRFKRDNQKFDRFYRSDNDLYLSIASRELRKIKEESHESPVRVNNNASLSMSRSNQLEPLDRELLHKDHTKSQIYFQNASQTSFRPNSSMISSKVLD